MLPRLSWLTLVAITFWITGGLGQDSSSSAALNSLPECALNCLIEAYGQGLCEPRDLSCSCTNAEYQGNVTLCVSTSCTIPDALFTKNATSAACGAPIRDRAPTHTAVVGALVGLTAVAVSIRFGYRLFVAEQGLGLDDWFVIASLACIAASESITEAGTVPNGLGKDLWTLEPEQITKFLYYFYHMAWLYFLEIPLMKLSMLFFYLRIFPQKEVRRVIYGTIAFTVAWGTAYVLTSIFQCSPINYYWLKWDGLHEGVCVVETKAFTWSQAVLNITQDIWMLGIPLWQIKNLQMNRKTKIGVASMFFVGMFVTVVSIVRLRSLVKLSNSDNVTYDYFDVSIWSSIEITVGIICACMPTIRLALAKVWPSIMRGSSLNRSGYYGSKSRDRHLNGHSRRRISGNPLEHGFSGREHGTVRVEVEGGPDERPHYYPSPGFKKSGGAGGIVVSQERSVHNVADLDIDEYVGGDGESSNSDEATLVKMKDLSPQSPRFP